MKFVKNLGLALVLMSTVSAGEWPQFRGPFFNGSTDETNLPSSWSATENIAWTADLPGPSAATPAVWGDAVLVSSTDLKGDAVLASCFDRKTGARRWAHKVGSGVRRDIRSSYAAPSPATDGNLAVFFYGSGQLVAFNMAGAELWKRDIQTDFGEFAFNWTTATSPVLFGGKLYVQILQRDVPVGGRGLKDRENESYILAVDPKTGKDLWRHTRPSKARAESRESFATPLPFERNGRKELLVIGGDALSGHDLESGKELWRWGTWNPTRIKHWRHVPSPVASQDVVLICAPKNDPVYAIKTGGTGKLSAESVAWVSDEIREITSDVPTPAYYDGDFFVLSDKRKFLSRVVPSTGKVKWSVRTPGDPKIEASPLAADGKIYTINFRAEVTIFNASDGSVVKTIAMDPGGADNVRSSVVAAHGQIFLRTNDKLICVGKKK